MIALLDGVPPLYFLAQPGGAFVDFTATGMPAIGYPRPRAILADVDGDLDRDLVMTSTNNLPPRLFENVAGNFVDVAGAFGTIGVPANSILGDRSGWYAATGDRVWPRGYCVQRTERAHEPRRRVSGDIGPCRPCGSMVCWPCRLRTSIRTATTTLCFLESDGSLGYALNGLGGALIGQPAGGGTSTTQPFPLLRPQLDRVALSTGDLEGDGDDDIVSGGDCQDSLLLHGPGDHFHDTERLAFPTVQRLANYATAVIDLNGNGDLRHGRPCIRRASGSLLTMTGQATTGPLVTTGMLPPLSNTVLWGAVAPMSLVTPRRDLLVLGMHPAAGPQVALLVDQGGAWVDETAARFAGPQTGTLAAVAAYPGNNGLQDLVLGHVCRRTRTARQCRWSADAAAGRVSGRSAVVQSVELRRCRLHR